MRIWDFPVDLLCSAHLSAEHRELHGILGCINKNSKNGYINHPEVKRWIGNLPALYRRHQDQLNSFIIRNPNHIHSSYIDADYSNVLNVEMIESLESQYANIAAKRNDENHKCTCDLIKLKKYMDSI